MGGRGGKKCEGILRWGGGKTKITAGIYNEYSSSTPTDEEDS